MNDKNGNTQRSGQSIMDAHEPTEYVPHNETLASRLELVGFVGDDWIEHSGVTSSIFQKGVVRVSVWHRGDPRKMIGCVSHPGDDPDETYWEALGITNGENEGGLL